MKSVKILSLLLVLFVVSGCVSTGITTAPVVKEQDLGLVRAQIIVLVELAANVDASMPEDMDESLAETLTVMQEQKAAVGGLKAQGCIGESNRGYLRLQESPLLEDRDLKNAAQKVLAAENKSRKTVYRQVTEMNKSYAGLTVTLVESLFALEQLKRTHPGGMVQIPKKGALLDEVLALDRVKALGAGVEADAWVALP